MKRALFIGRFQPFHAGHLSVIEQVSKNYDEVIIGIGSAQYSDTKENPFSFYERKAMIEAVLQSALPHIAYYIVALPDIHNDEKWVKHITAIVENSVGKYDMVYTGNEWVKELLEKAQQNVEVIHKDINISATQIRNLIRSGSPRWKEYVHPSIQQRVATGVKQV